MNKHLFFMLVLLSMGNISFAQLSVYSFENDFIEAEYFWEAPSGNIYNSSDVLTQNNAGDSGEWKFYKVQEGNIRTLFSIDVPSCAINITNRELEITERVLLYPNPAEETITIREVQKFRNLTISNISGKILTQYNIDSNDVTVNTSEYAPGMYVLVLVGENLFSSQTFIIN